MDSHAAFAPASGLPGSQARTTPRTADIKPAELLALARRNAVPVALCAFIGAGAAYAYASSLPKSYTASAAVAVEGDRLAIPELQGVLKSEAAPDPMPFVRTEVQALGARQLVARLVDELHLDRDPEFNAALRPPTLMGEITAGIKSLLPHGTAASGDANSKESIINAADHALSITQDNRSLVIGVAFTAHDPNLAAAAVNRLIADYVSERTSRRTAADQGANTAINQRIDQVRGDIERLEKQMQDLRTKSGLINVRAGSVGQQQVEDLATAASQATLQRTQAEANLARAQAAAESGSAEDLGSVISSETISRLREQESEASSRVADLSARFGPAYPALRSAEADLYAVRRQLAGEARRIVASLSTQLKIAQAHEADVQAQLNQARHAGADAQDVQAQLQQLQQDVATRRSLYSTLLERAQQTVAQPQADELPDVRVLSNATAPGLPSAPNMKLSAGLGGIAGGVLAGLVAFVRSAKTARFYSDSDIESATGAEILARLSGRTRSRGWTRLPGTGGNVETDTDSAPLRTAMARMRAAARTGSVRTIAFTGAQAGTAAAYVATAFGRNAARDGQPVLLIEAGAGQPSVSRVLHAGNGGLSDVLRGQLDWRDGVQRDTAGGLDLLLAGTQAAFDAAADRVALENILVEAREDYALILLAAPLATDASALALARIADITVLVIDEAHAYPNATRAAATQLASMSRARLGAIVLNAA